SLFIIGHMGLFFYTQKGSIISTVVLPTTEIIEPKKPDFLVFLINILRAFQLLPRIDYYFDDFSKSFPNFISHTL
ncbi:hypothetical protein F6P67_10425, partial [Streptococcus suis]|nr:hypothetical protein [Streptococcus suis]